MTLHELKQKGRTAYRAAHSLQSSLPDAQGIHGKVLWDQATMKPKTAKRGDFFKFPVKFPASREFQGFRWTP